MKSKMKKKMIAFLLCMVLVICNSVSILADTPAAETTTTEQKAKETRTAKNEGTSEEEKSSDNSKDTSKSSEETEETTEEAPETKTTEKKEETTGATTEKKEESATATTTEKKEETEESSETSEKKETEEAEETATTGSEEETSEASEETTEIAEDKEKENAVTELTYENDDVIVTVSEVTEGAIPEGAELKVVPILKDDAETQAQYEEVEQKIQEKAAETETEIKGFLAYDITFVDEDGNEIEPNSEVKVSIEYRQAAISDELSEEDAKNTEVSVMHLEEDADGNVSQVVDMGEAGKIDALETTDTKQVEKVEVKTESFSAYVIAWTMENVFVENSIQTAKNIENQTVSFENIAEDYVPQEASNTNDWQIVDGKYTSPIEYEYSKNGEVRIAKKVIPTNIENEFYIYLDIEPKMEWSTETLLSRADIWIVNSNNTATGISNASLPDTAQGIKDKANSLGLNGIGQIAKLCTSAEEAAMQSTNTTQDIDPNNVKKPQKIVISETDEVVLEGSFYYGISQNSRQSFTLLVSVPGTGKFFKMGGVSYDENTQIMTIPQEAYQELEEEIENIGDYGSMVQTAIPESVSDTMGKHIDFVNYGDSNNGKTSKFNETSKNFTWGEFTELSSDSDANHYETVKYEGQEYIYKKYAYQLVYKIRLDVTEDDFQSCAEELFGDSENNNTHYLTNASTILEYNIINEGESTKAESINFTSPVVKGLLYDIEFQKVDENGSGLAGAEFQIKGSYFGEDKTQEVTSANDGSVKFKGLPWGTYTLTEIQPPEDYKMGENPIQENIILCYTTNRGLLEENHDTGDASDEVGDVTRALYKDTLIGNNGTIVNEKATTAVTVEKKWVIADKSYNANASIEVKLEAKVDEDEIELPGNIDTTVTLTGEIKNGEVVNGNDWTYTFTNLPKEYEGQSIDYAVIETKINNFDIDNQSTFVCEIEGREGNHFIITNTYISPWMIRKVSSTDDSIGLANALFTLTNKKTEKVYYGKSYMPGVYGGQIAWFENEEDIDKMDEMLKYIPNGTYILEEIKAPDGYQKSEITWTIEVVNLQLTSIVDSEGNRIYPMSTRAMTTEVSFVNKPLYSLPSAGGPGIYWYTLSGTLLMAGAALIVYRQKCKREVLLRK